MSCSYEEDLTAYVDGELAEGQQTKLQAHLPGCGECQKTLALLQRSVAQLSALPAYEPSGALRKNVLSRIDAPPSAWERVRAALRPAVFVPAGALFAAVVVALVWAGGGADPAPQVADAAQLELAANLEVIEDLDVVGLESPEDLEVIRHLEELEAMP